MGSRRFVATFLLLAALCVAAAGCNQSAPAPTKSTGEAPAAQDFATSDQPLSVGPKGEIANAVDPSASSATISTANDSFENIAESTKTEPTAANTSRRFQDPQGAELTMPKVVLSRAHSDICRVKVGDRLPDFQLADLTGAAQSLEKLLGPQLTVVTFWTSAQPSALEQLADLNPDVVERFSGFGVEVVGINEGDDPQAAAELAKQAGANFPNLSDRDGSALGQIARGKLPRTYLVDAGMNVVWFDLEYSRTTRRELSQAIRYWLLHHAPSAQPAP